MRKLFEYWQMGFTLASHYQQMLAWEDAHQARIARARAESLAAEQARAMLAANPDGRACRAALTIHPARSPLRQGCKGLQP